MATEEIRGIPFDSRLQIAEDGTQYEDREVFSADIAKYFGFLSSDGICVHSGEILGDDLKVDPSTDGIITINTGTIKIQGRIGWVEEQITRQLDAGGSKPRYDTVVIELNLNTAERRFIAKVVKGEEADEPVPPELTRTATVYQLGLADIYRIANSTVTGTITDTREDAARCGVSTVVEAIPDMTAEELIDLTDFEEGTPDNIIPKATKSLLGCVVVGDGLEVDDNAVLSANHIIKLWENASPTSEFAAQTISLDLSGYDAIEIEFVLTTTTRYGGTCRVSVGNAFNLSLVYASSSKVLGCYRVGTTNDTGITFQAGYNTSPSTNTSNNGYCVPIAIYGIKGVK